jgi:hypothetical protein
MADLEIIIDPNSVPDLEAALKRLRETPPFGDERAERARLELIASTGALLDELARYPDSPRVGQPTNILQHLHDAALMSNPKAVSAALAFSDGAVVRRYREAIHDLTGIWPRDLLIGPLMQPFPRAEHDGTPHTKNFGWKDDRLSLLRTCVPNPDDARLDHALLHELFHAGQGHDPSAEARARWSEEIAMLEGAIETLCYELGPLTGTKGCYYAEIGIIRLLAKERGLAPTALAQQIWQSPRPLLTLAAHLQGQDTEAALDQIAAQAAALQQRLRPLVEDKALGDFLAEVDRLQPRLSELDTSEPSLNTAVDAAITEPSL